MRAALKTPTDSRQPLRAAKAELAKARTALETAQAGTARARQVIADADIAEREAEEAEDDFIASAANDPFGDTGLAEKAEQARTKAKRARLVAKGVSASLVQSAWEND